MGRDKQGGHEKGGRLPFSLLLQHFRPNAVKEGGKKISEKERENRRQASQFLAFSLFSVVDTKRGNLGGGERKRGGAFLSPLNTFYRFYGKKRGRRPGGSKIKFLTRNRRRKKVAEEGNSGEGRGKNRSSFIITSRKGRGEKEREGGVVTARPLLSAVGKGNKGGKRNDGANAEQVLYDIGPEH